MWMKIQRVKTVIYSAALLAAASSLMSVANAAEELQTTLRVEAHLAGFEYGTMSKRRVTRHPYCC